MSILDSVLSVASGGLTGVIGSAVSAVYAFKSKQLDVELEKSKFQNEIELKKADAAIAAQEWAARTQVADITATAQVDAEDAKAFAVAQQSEPQRYASGRTG